MSASTYFMLFGLFLGVVAGLNSWRWRGHWPRLWLFPVALVLIGLAYGIGRALGYWR